MSHLSELIESNKGYSENSHVAREIVPRTSTLIISCVDARTDPANFLGLEDGEALVLRNAGGRITPETEFQIAMLCSIIERAGGPQLRVILVHHTDCGMQRFPTETQQAVAAATGIPTDFLASIAMSSPEESLAIDAAAIASSSSIPKGIEVQTVIYDVVSGELNQI